jgi:Tfp pilus assembly protein PilE
MIRILKISGQKVTGFTIVEILITMIVSGIVVLSAFQFYNIFNKLLLQKSRTMAEGKEIIQFYDVLKNDVAKAITMKSSGKELLMEIPEKKIRYEFFNDYVVRIQNAMADTFLVDIIDMNTIKDLTTGYDKSIILEILKNKETFPVILEKNYPNDVLLNATIFPDK